MADEAETTEENPPVDLSTFTTIEQFDNHIEELQATPTAANLKAQAEAITARTEFADALAAVQTAEAEAAAADEEATAAAETPAPTEEATPPEEPEQETPETQTETAEVETPEVDRELVNASVSGTALPTTDPAPTGLTKTPRRTATVRGVHGQTYGPVGEMPSNAVMANLINKAVKGSGDTAILEFDRWDRELVGEGNVLKADNKASENDRILGLIDANGNEIGETDAPITSAAVMKASKVHRANCGGCSDCSAVLETPDCFAEYGEPLGESFDSIPADTCKWSVEPQQTLAQLTQQVYVYCGDDGAGNPVAGILDAAGNAVPIDPADDTTWKSIVDIDTDCGDKVPYSLEEFPLLFRVPRNQDLCNASSVARTINRYLALQSRFMEARKYQILRDDALSRGFAFQVTAAISDAADDLAAFVSIVSAIMAEQAGVDGLEGMRLAVPRGFAAHVNARNGGAGVLTRLSDATGITGIVEVGGTGMSPYGDAAYALTPDTPLVVDLDAEKQKTWEFVAFDATQWRKPVGQTVRIGVTDTFRDMDLAAQNARGIVIYRDETLIPVGCDPSIALDATLCASGSLPGRVDLQC